MAMSLTFYRMLPAAMEGSGGGSWALPTGFAVSAALFFLMPRPYRTYVLGHELTHALWGLLAGARVGRIKVSRRGGHVMLSKSNFMVSLAPYFFPIYAGLVVTAWCIAGWFLDLEPYRNVWLVVVGLTWGFHITFTVYMLTQRQPDIEEHGRVFSYTVIYLANLFFVALWIVLFSPVTLRATLDLFVPAWIAAWSGVLSFVTATTRLVAGWLDALR